MTKTKRILVVEDDPMIRDFLCELLQAKGFATRCCTEGETALKMAEEAPPDVVITDYRLPGMNGVEIAVIMRARRPEALIIGMSSENKADIFRDAGADFFIQKPFPVQNLVSIITKGRGTDA